jgi:hypothetical protein
MLALTMTVALALVKVVPGSSLAEVKLDSGEADLKKLGLTPRASMPGWFERTESGQRFAPLSARIENGKVIDIDLTLSPDDAVDWGTGAGPVRESLSDMAKRYGKCGPIDPRMGATWVQCDDGVSFVQTIAGRGIRLQKSPKPKEHLCHDYAEQGRTVEVAQGRTVCLGKLALTRATMLAQVEAASELGFCETVTDKSGVSTRRCRGTHLVFDPDKTLRRVQILAPQQ